MNSFTYSKKRTTPFFLRQMYDNAAAGWQSGIEKLGYMCAYERLIDRAFEMAPMQANETILDAGSGTGAISIALTNRHKLTPKLHLLDLSPAMLDEARACVPGPVQTTIGLIGCAELPDQAFDRVLCAHALEHTVDTIESLVWLRNRLKRGGQIVLTVSRPHWCTTLLRWRYGNVAYAPDKVFSFLEKTGFSDIQIARHQKGPPARTSCGFIARYA